MVRFIINMTNKIEYMYQKIYIPIWLDLLYFGKSVGLLKNYDLHSNMVRFIMHANIVEYVKATLFTFQYG